jgi:hypothetical protein
MALPGSDKVKDNIASFKKLNMMAKVKQYISYVVTIYTKIGNFYTVFDKFITGLSWPYFNVHIDGHQGFHCMSKAT